MGCQLSARLVADNQIDVRADRRDIGESEAGDQIRGVVEGRYLKIVNPVTSPVEASSAEPGCSPVAEACCTSITVRALGLKVASKVEA